MTKDRVGRMSVAFAAAVCLLSAAPAVLAQGRGGRAGGGRGATPAGPSEEGIPVTNELVLSKCGGCHTKDEKGNLSRISWIRTTPEGWEEAIKRMVRLNGLTLEPADAKLILKYLSNHQGLAPEEAKPVMYMARTSHSGRNRPERIFARHLYELPRSRPALSVASNSRRVVLTGRHAFGTLSHSRDGVPAQRCRWTRRRGGRRTSGAYAAADGGATDGAPGAAPAGAAVSLDATLDFLGKNYPLHTPEWATWRARMRAPKIAGKWLIAARIVGRGKYYGELTIAQGTTEDEFTTTVKLQSVNGGPAITRAGSGLVYAGYSWRGRSHGGTPAANASPDDLNNEMREALWISPDQTKAEGRWFWGEYQEFGVDVKLTRETPEPTLLTLDALLAFEGWIPRAES